MAGRGTGDRKQAGAQPRASQEPIVIRIDPIDEAALATWQTVERLAQTFADNDDWCLIGGQMTALFALEAGQVPRPTEDIDLLSDARAQPSMTQVMASRLREIGARLLSPEEVGEDHGFRFKLDDETIDVLAPDGIKNRGLTTLEGMSTIPVPGGTQALKRSEVVQISVAGGEPVNIRRPALIGAILIKARSLMVHNRPDDQRSDLITLLSCLTDPRSAKATASAKELGWLRKADSKLKINDSAFESQFAADRLLIARAAWQILIRHD